MATIAFAQYPSTGDYSQSQYPSTPAPAYRQPAPVVQGGNQQGPVGRAQGYNPSYTRSSISDERDARAYNDRFAPPENRYPASDTLGPVSDFHQDQQFQPDFNRQPPPAPQRELFPDAQVIALVVDEPILAGDLMGDINQMLAPYKDKATPEQLDEQRRLLMQRLLPQQIQTKMLYQEMLANVPPEAIPQIREKLNSEFDTKQLPNLMERAKVNSPAELDAKLRGFGTSLEKQRRQFIEQVLARENVRQNVQAEPDVSHDEMLRYYQENAADYDRPLRVRWEELAVKFSEFPSKAEAYRAIAELGNRVLRGAAFSRVAREQSQGFTADNGGWYDWTLQKSLKYPEVEAAIFSLPTNQLSRVIETEDGFHIVRVLDREEAGRTPFFQEQSHIKSKLQKEKRDVAVEEYLAKVRAKTKVWTIFDGQPQPEVP